MMKANEIRKMSAAELDAKLVELKKNLFMLRMQHATNQLDNPLQIAVVTQLEISAELYVYEQKMSYEYIPGVEAFIADLRRNGAKIAVVTSSNEEKMANVYNAHPEFKGMVDRILTGEMFARSKPAPDCFLLGMEIFEATPENTYVFEDSFHGLQAGMTSGATVIGLATTNTREAITGKAHYIIDDFTGMTYDKLLILHR